MGLARDVPYRIGVKIANQDSALYPRLAWNADRDPMVLAGDSPLRFDAYAVKTGGDATGSAIFRGAGRTASAIRGRNNGA